MRYVSLISLLAFIPCAAVAAPASTTIICSAEMEITFSRSPEQIGRRKSSEARIYQLDDESKKIISLNKDGVQLNLCSKNCEVAYGEYMIGWRDNIVSSDLKVTVYRLIDRISGTYYESHDSYYNAGRLIAFEVNGICEPFPLIERKF